MQREAADTIVASASGEVAGLAAEVHGLAQGAKACAEAGSREGAIQLLLEIEPLIYDLQRLIDLASFANKRAREREPA